MENLLICKRLNIQEFQLDRQAENLQTQQLIKIFFSLHFSCLHFHSLDNKHRLEANKVLLHSINYRHFFWWHAALIYCKSIGVFTCFNTFQMFKYSTHLLKCVFLLRASSIFGCNLPICSSSFERVFVRFFFSFFWACSLSCLLWRRLLKNIETLRSSTVPLVRTFELSMVNSCCCSPFFFCCFSPLWLEFKTFVEKKRKKC